MSSDRHTEESLLDRTLIRVDLETYEAFVRRLDAKPRPNARLIKTMRTPAPWEKP